MVGEVRHRLKNTCLEVDQEDMEAVLMDFMDNLAAMGYGQRWRREVLKAAMKGYMRVLKKCSNGETRRNRLGVSTFMNRRYIHLAGKQDWF